MLVRHVPKQELVSFEAAKREEYMAQLTAFQIRRLFQRTFPILESSPRSRLGAECSDLAKAMGPAFVVATVKSGSLVLSADKAEDLKVKHDSWLKKTPIFDRVTRSE